jgi:hypothetical protein
MLIENLAASDEKLSRSHQKALWTWDREATTSFERIPLSILYKTTPCATTMPTMAPAQKIRLNIPYRSGL